MDVLSEVLAGVRTSDGVLHRSVLRVPYGLRIEERAPLTISLLLDGPAYVVFDDGEVVPMRPGVVYLIADPTPYTLADRPESPARLVVDAGGARTIDGVRLPPPVDDVRCLVEPAEGSPTTTVVSGNYAVSDGMGRRLLQALPRACAIDVPETAGLVALLEAELDRGTLGRQPVLDRWLDLLLTAALRERFTDESTGPGWVATTDPVVGAALRAMHDAPASGWTVATLARAGGLSRSAFAERFSAHVGVPPMAYLAELRMDIATDLLLADRAPLTAIAQAVGYADPFGFSAAYKRVRGRSPAQVRAGGRERITSSA